MTVHSAVQPYLATWGSRKRSYLKIDRSGRRVVRVLLVFVLALIFFLAAAEPVVAKVPTGPIRGPHGVQPGNTPMDCDMNDFLTQWSNEVMSRVANLKQPYRTYLEQWLRDQFGLVSLDPALMTSALQSVTPVCRDRLIADIQALLYSAETSFGN